MAVDIFNETPHYFDSVAIKKSVEDTFLGMVPPDANHALVAIVTPEYAGIATAHKLDDKGTWKLVLQADITYHGKVDGQLKIVGTWK